MGFGLSDILVLVSAFATLLAYRFIVSRGCGMQSTRCHGYSRVQESAGFGDASDVIFVGVLVVRRRVQDMACDFIREPSV